jgi:1,2-diacylglycerol 3-alpha-glucosyltransferase
MHVLLISDVYFPRINGVSTHIQTFIRTTSKSDDVCLIAPDYGTPWDDEGHNVIRVPSYPTPGDHEDRLMYGREVRKLLPQLRKQAFDIVHIHTFGIAFHEGMKLARALKLPVVFTYHTHFEEYLSHYVSFLPASITRFGCHQLAIWECNSVDTVVVPSQAMALNLQRNGVKSRMHVVPTGIDLIRFKNGDGSRFRRRYRISPNGQILLFVGRVAPEKNVDFLIRMLGKAVVRFPDVLLVIVGGGHDLERLRDLTYSLGLSRNVVFTGWLSRDTELLDCYDAADIFVFASRTETQGLALLEAMAMGLPIVSTSRLGSADTVQPRRGAIVVPEDEYYFAGEVCRLLSDMCRREKLGSEARRYGETCSASAMVR